jgi:hypothetical protein
VVAGVFRFRLGRSYQDDLAAEDVRGVAIATAVLP